MILNHIIIWKQITSDPWILKTILAATIEIEDPKNVSLGESKHLKNNLRHTKDAFQKRDEKAFRPRGHTGS